MSEGAVWAPILGAHWLVSGAPSPTFWSELLGGDKRLDPYLVWADATSKPFVRTGDKPGFSLWTLQEHASRSMNATSPSTFLSLPVTGPDELIDLIESIKTKGTGARLLAFELAIPRALEQSPRGHPYAMPFPLAKGPLVNFELGYFLTLKIPVARGGATGLFDPTALKKELSELTKQLESPPITNKPSTFTSPLVCVIDDRCNFASRAFGTRVQAIWNQTSEPEALKKLAKTKRWLPKRRRNSGGVARPEDGHDEPTGMMCRMWEKSSSEKGAPPYADPKKKPGRGMLSETEWYRDLAYLYPTPQWSHGAAVLDVLAGHDIRLSKAGLGTTLEEIGRQRWSMGPPDDLVFVQLPVATVLDTSGGSLSTHVIDGIEFAVGSAKPGQAVIVNLSYGTHSGPHDGGSMFERALCAQLTRYNGSDGGLADGKKLHVVVPAGNSHIQRCHASQTLAPGKELSLLWKVLPDDPTDNFVEIWLDAGDEVVVKVQPPSGNASPPVSAGQAWSWKAGDEAQAAVVFPKHVSQHESARMILVAVSPTRGGGYVDADGDGRRDGISSFETTARPRVPKSPLTGANRGEALAPHGIWTITICNVKASTGKPEQCASVHAWVQRGDSAPGRGRETRGHVGRQSYFVDDGTGLVNPRFTLNGIATAKHARLFVVGAMRHQDHAVSKYSAAGPNRGTGERLEGPDVMTIGDQSRNMPGLLLRGSSAGSRVRVSGTSVAAPLVARFLYEHLASRRSADSFLPKWFNYDRVRVDKRAEGEPESAEPAFRGECVRLVPTTATGDLISPRLSPDVPSNGVNHRPAPGPVLPPPPPPPDVGDEVGAVSRRPGSV